MYAIIPHYIRLANSINIDLLLNSSFPRLFLILHRELLFIDFTKGKLLLNSKEERERKKDRSPYSFSRK